MYALHSDWAFYLKVDLPLSFRGTWSGWIHNVQIAVLELQVTALMLNKLAFRLSGKVSILYLSNSTAKGYFCNQNSSKYFLFSVWPVIFCINQKALCNSHFMLYMNTYLQRRYFSWGRLVLEWHLLPCTCQTVFQLWLQLDMDLLAPSYQSMSASLHTGNCHLWELWDWMCSTILGTFRSGNLFLLLH